MRDAGRLLLTILLLAAAWGVEAQTRGEVSLRSETGRAEDTTAGPPLETAPGRPGPGTVGDPPEALRSLAEGVRTGSPGADTAPRRVVVDPGHGGDQAGSRAPRGAAEKDVVLHLARTIAEALRGRGFEVHLTRTDDRSLGEEQRAAVANYWQADLFLSLHASGVGRPQARGFEVMVAPEPGPGTDGRLWSAGQAGGGAESRRWAELLRAGLGGVLPTFDRGLVVLPNPVLEATVCPACLVEVGSLAWPGEEELLSTPAGRSAIAAAVTRAAEAFFEDAPADALRRDPRGAP